MNGNIDLTLPEDTKADLKMRTENGDVYTDFDVKMRPLNEPPAADDQRDRGGRYRAQITRNTFGSINGGGPEYDLRTFNGQIYVRKGRK